MARHNNNHHLLVSQNFLRSISRPNRAKPIEFFASPEQNKKSMESAAGVSWTLGASQERDEEDTRPSTSDKERRGTEGNICEVSIAKKKVSYEKNPRPTILQRISRMISSDDLVDKRSEDLEELLTDNTGSHSSFLKRFRSTVTRGERVLMCSECAPVVLFTHFPLTSPFSTHRRSFSERIPERLRHIFSNELKPIELRDDEELAYGRILRLSRIRTTTNRSMKSFEGENAFLSVDDSRSVASAVISRANSCEPSSVSVDPPPVDLDDLLTEEFYEPEMLCDIESVCKATCKYNGYVSTMYLYVSDEDLKKRENECFRQKFPNIQLTFSKLKSIKREMAEVCTACGVDPYTLAHAYVYFEKIVVKAAISKSNRKLVASACLLVAIKVNDPPETRIKDIIDKLESTFRVSRRDILAYELPVCLSLSFKLFPDLLHIENHYHRLLFSRL